MWWVQIRSWHAVKLTRSIESRTLCGRIAAQSAPVSDTLPGEKSCETCLRIVARRADA
jgi:hypothetical protein